jgi:hypothetical protein
MAPSNIDAILPVWWPSKFFYRCTPRILVVVDSLSFGSDGFGLATFLAQIALSTPTPTITTMKHGPEKFGPVHSTANFEQIWLFGAGGPALDDGEIKVLTAFMEQGGGVFATGDHETLGFPLCGELPRIRKMREWQNTPMVNGRIDTVINPGRNHAAQFHDQSDDIPQHMFPTYYGSGTNWAPHALLRSPIGDIDVLPDHPHESECFVGNNLGANYNLHGLNFAEFPALGGQPLSPEIVAHSVSAGRFLTDAHKPPTTPRVFGAISAWDGHRVRKGRIVCDATWHHFININLDGTDADPDPLDARKGLHDSAGNPTEDFQQVTNYYRNIVDWLIPANRRWCSIFSVLVFERYRFPLFEEFVPLPVPDPHPCPWDLRVVLGQRVDAALTAHRGRGHADDLAIAALELAGFDRLANHLRPLPPDAKRDDAASLLQLEEFRTGIIGSIADALLRDLPADPYQLEARLEGRSHDDKEIEAQVVRATKEAVESATEYYKRAVDNTLSVLG